MPNERKLPRTRPKRQRRNAKNHVKTPSISLCWFWLHACTLFVGDAHGAEEVIRTPSDQMKEAVNKLGKTPATIGKSLQGLTDAAKEKLRQTFGAKAKTDAKADAVDLNVSEESG